jgi:hypothetical protein
MSDPTGPGRLREERAPSPAALASLIRTRAFRRAVAFFIGIGVPALTGLWLHQSGALLLGVVAALMFSFADEEGPLTRRLLALGQIATGMTVGGAVGWALGHYGPVFWVLFVSGALAAAWLNRSGKTPHIGARIAVMALAITAGTQAVSLTEALFGAGALAVVVVVRLVDHAIFGPLPPSSLSPRRSAPESDALWARYAIAYAAAAAIGLWVGTWFDPQHAIWVAITSLVVMQPDDRSNYRRIFERVIGTIVGVAAAFVLTQLVRSLPLTVAALLITAAALPHHIPLRYWLHTAAIALLVLLTYDLASRAVGAPPELAPALFTERLVDVLIGCALAFAATELAFPWRELRERVGNGQRPG